MGTIVSTKWCYDFRSDSGVDVLNHFHAAPPPAEVSHIPSGSGHFLHSVCQAEWHLWACRFQMCHRDAPVVFQPKFWGSPFTLWQWAAHSSWGGQLISDFLLQSSRNSMLIPHLLHLHYLGWMEQWRPRSRGLGRKAANERERKEGKKEKKTTKEGRVGDRVWNLTSSCCSRLTPALFPPIPGLWPDSSRAVLGASSGLSFSEPLLTVSLLPGMLSLSFPHIQVLSCSIITSAMKAYLTPSGGNLSLS